MRRDIHTKNEKIVSLENSLEAQQTRYETDLLALRQKLADNTRDNQMEMQHMEANFQDQIESLTQKHKVHLKLIAVPFQATVSVGQQTVTFTYANTAHFTSVLSSLLMHLTSPT